MPRRPQPRHLLVLTILTAALLTAAGGPPEGDLPEGDKMPEAIRAKLERTELVPHDDPMGAARFDAARRAVTDGDPTSISIRLERERAHVEEMPRYSTRLGLELPSLASQRAAGTTKAAARALGTWEALGPGNIGGRTRALVIHPENPQRIYTAGVAGGVWRSDDGGASWRPLDEFMANLAVTSLAMDPENSEVIYAGTGEGFTQSVFLDGVHSSGMSFRGAGIFKTTDGGETWNQLEATAGPEFHYVHKVVVSTNNPNRVYAGTFQGLFRSRNGGQSWVQILDPEVFGGCLDLALRTDKAKDFLFASCGNFEQATIYRNLNANRNRGWQAVLSERGMGRTSLAIAPSKQGIVYALSSSIIPGPGGNFEHGLHAVYRSNRSGKEGSWKKRTTNRNADKLDTLLLSNPVIASLTDCNFDSSDSYSNLGWWANEIVVDPLRPNVVWAGGIDIFRSDDGGRSWGLAGHWWADPSQAGYVHADKHAFVFHPDYDANTNRMLYVASDGGVARTDDTLAPTLRGRFATCDTSAPGVSWVSLNNGYEVTQFYHGAPYPDGTRYLAGAQDNGTLEGSDAGGIDGWREVFGGDGGWVAIDPNDPNVIYVETQNLGLRKSIDGGANFQDATTGINETSDTVAFITPFVMDPSNPQRLWTGGRSMWRTDNGALSWQRASRPLANDSPVSAIAVAPSNSKRVLAGVMDGRIFRENRAGQAGASTRWREAQPREGYVTSLAFDPILARVAYAGYGGFGGEHLWRSENGGASWESIDGEGASALPDLPVLSIAVDPADGQRIYVGTELGVFVTTDGGASWAVENTGFANVVTEALAIREDGFGGRELYAFTHGRGAWRVPITD